MNIINTEVTGIRILVFGVVYLCAWTSALDTEVCDVVPDMDPTKHMPALHEAYEAGILLSQSLIQESSELLLATDDLKAYTKVTAGRLQLTYIGDYGRDQLIKIIKDEENNLQCIVSNLTTAATNGDWIFGYNATQGPHPNDPGWVFHMKDFAEVYTGMKNVMGIPCNRWEACTEVPMRDKTTETIGVKYYWSNPEQWTPVMGVDENEKSYSVPVRIQLTRRVKGKIEVEEMNVFRYSIPGPSGDLFNVPDGVYCPGLNSEGIGIPKLPHAFSYSSEIILRSVYENMILYQKHYFDDELNITRLVFTPFYKGEIEDQPKEVSETTLIQDKNTGVAYVIDRDYGWCAMESIDKISDMLRQAIPERTENILSYLNDENIQYTYYEKKTERGIPASVFVGERVKDTLYVEFWFSEPFQEIQGDGMWTTRKPIKFSTYIQNDPLRRNSIDVNIFHFDAEKPDTLDYDITSCPLDRHKIQFTLMGRYDAVSPNILRFKRSILKSLMTAMSVSPLRVHNIELGESGDNTNVSFTLIGQPQEYVVSTYPDIPSDLAIKQLKNAIDNDQFLVAEEGSLPLLAVAGSMMMDVEYLAPLPTENPNSRSSSDRPSEQSTLSPDPSADKSSPKDDTDSGSYSGGSMAALGISMVLLGGVLGGGIVFLIIKKPIRWPKAFERTRFVNEPEAEFTANNRP